MKGLRVGENGDGLLVGQRNLFYLGVGEPWWVECAELVGEESRLLSQWEDWQLSFRWTPHWLRKEWGLCLLCSLCFCMYVGYYSCYCNQVPKEKRIRAEGFYFSLYLKEEMIVCHDKEGMVGKDWGQAMKT